MEKLNRNQNSWRIILLMSILIVLSPLNLIFNNINISSSVLFHTLLEIISTSLALFISILALVRYYSKKNDVILFIGVGFLGTALLEAFHGIFSHTSLTSTVTDDFILEFPWSWLAPRYFLSFFLVLSFIAWRYRKNLFQTDLEKEKYYLALSLILTVATFIFFIYTPIIPDFNSLGGLARPLELIPALFFAIALVGYLYKGRWKNDAFEYCLVLSLLINFICQCFYMPFSDVPFDKTGNMAHYLKIIGYIIVIVGLLINLNQNYQLAEAANRTKTDFLNIMSQEVRNPLTIILGYTPILKSPEKMPKVKALIDALDKKKISQDEFRTQLDESLNELSKYSLRMDASGKNLLALINDMLDLSKIEAGMMTAKGAEIDLYPVMTKICQPFQVDANKKGLSLNIRANGYKIYANLDKFSKVLSILVDNAIKYSDSGLIDINCLQNNDMIEISVTDTGRGIKPEMLNNMIDRFLNPTIGTNNYSGDMGLSLTLCQALVELHGGTISVMSKLNQGSTFTVTFPVSPSL